MCKEGLVKNVNRTSRLLLSVLALSIPLLSSEKMALGQERAPSSFALNSRLNDNFGRLPMSFEANRGQTGPQVKFLARGAGYSLFLTDSGAVFTFSEPNATGSTLDGPRLQRVSGFDAPKEIGPQGPARRVEPHRKVSTLRMSLAGARNAPILSAEDALPGTANYFTGSDPTNWHTAVPTYAKVRYSGVYPGVDLVYYGNQQQLEYDFVVAPHADASRIQFRLDGAKALAVDSTGDLVIGTEARDIRFRKPTIYQQIDGKKQFIEGGFLLGNNGTVGFRLAAYDHQMPLIIDPVLAYSTYFPGGSVQAMAVDAAGEVVITGSAGAGFPTTPGAFEPKDPETGIYSLPIFVAKLNAEGSALVYATYLAGKGFDESDTVAYGLAVDSEGNAYMVGQTNETDFPITKGAFRTAGKYVENGTGFVTKLNATGTKLVYSTYFGGTVSNNPTPGNWIDISQGVAVDAAGYAFVVGITTAKDFPVTPHAFQREINPKNIRSACTVAELKPDGSGVEYGTYLGGSYSDQCQTIGIDAEGDATVGGYAQSSDYPVTARALQKKIPGVPGSGMISKLNSSGTELVYSTFLGGNSGLDEVVRVATDPEGNVYAMGETDSADFPTTHGSLEPHLDVAAILSFVTKFRAKDMSVVYSTYLGGTWESIGYGLAADSSGNAYVTGDTFNAKFPVTAGAFLTIPYGIYYKSEQPFLSKLNASGSALLYSTFLGGSGFVEDKSCGCAKAVALDQEGNVYLAGRTGSEDFPVTPGALITTLEGDRGEPPWVHEAIAPYVMKFNADEMRALPATTITVTANANPQKADTPVTFTAQVKSVRRGSSVPTGLVGFDFRGFIWETVPLDSKGIAKFTVTAGQLAPGIQHMVVMYLGDDSHAPSNTNMAETIK